jgi:hypothetical protein
MNHVFTHKLNRQPVNHNLNSNQNPNGFFLVLPIMLPAENNHLQIAILIQNYLSLIAELFERIINLTSTTLEAIESFNVNSDGRRHPEPSTRNGSPQ